MHDGHKPTWLAGAREVFPFSPLPDVSAGAVVAAGSAVAGVELLAENPSEAVLTLAEEGALQVKDHTQVSHVLSATTSETGRKNL